MANETKKPEVEVTAVVILRIPNLDTQEITALYKALQEITATYGGTFDVSTSLQNQFSE
jgi:hypothetical protein